LLKSKSVSKL